MLTHHPEGDELGLFKAEAVERGYAVRGFRPTIQVDEGPMPVLVVDQVNVLDGKHGDIRTLAAEFFGDVKSAAASECGITGGMCACIYLSTCACRSCVRVRAR